MIRGMRGDRFRNKNNGGDQCRFGLDKSGQNIQYQPIDVTTGSVVSIHKNKIHTVLIKCPALNNRGECAHGGYCTQSKYEGTSVREKTLA